MSKQLAAALASTALLLVLAVPLHAGETGPGSLEPHQSRVSQDIAPSTAQPDPLAELFGEEKAVTALVYCCAPAFDVCCTRMDSLNCGLLGGTGFTSRNQCFVICNCVGP